MSTLFVGNILSKHRGTLGPSEKIAELLGKQYNIRTVSDKPGKMGRLFDITKVCLTHNYNVLIADTYSGTAFNIARIASFIGKLRGKKVVLVLRGGKLPEFYSINAASVNRVFKRAHKILAPSLYLSDYFEQKGFNVEYLPDFINLDQFYDYGVQRKQFSLLWIRAFNAIYNPWLAVKTLYLLQKQFPETTLTMIGPDGGLLNETKKLAEELSVLNKIKFIGKVDNKQLPEFYCSHSVFLNTTSYESFGLAVMEAAACGIPIVSTSVGELPFLWKHNEEIMLCKPNDENAMTENVIRLFSQPDKAAAIALQANKKSARFGWKNVKPKWEKIMS